jgi:hypothetical protein
MPSYFFIIITQVWSYCSYYAYNTITTTTHVLVKGIKFGTIDTIFQLTISMAEHGFC